MRDEGFAEGAGPEVVVEVGGVDDLRGLVGEDGEEAGVAVAEGGYGDAGGEVDVAAVGEVPEVRAGTAGEDGGGAVVGGYHVVFVVGDEAGGGGVGGVGGWEGGLGVLVVERGC